jgi:REP element-mobilizing transposase RayT
MRVDRHWFFTWRTYATWLPGEDGFVGYYRKLTGERVIDNSPGSEMATAMPALAAFARSQCKSPPVLLTADQAAALVGQFHETASFRNWRLDAIAVLVNHVHLVFGESGESDPGDMLGDWKSYATRMLNRTWGRQPGGWWAGDGSKRPLSTAQRHWAALRYVRDQENPLVVWLSEQATAWLSAPPLAF